VLRSWVRLGLVGLGPQAPSLLGPHHLDVSWLAIFKLREWKGSGKEETHKVVELSW